MAECFHCFGNNGKSAHYHLGGVFVGGRQKWAFDKIGVKNNKWDSEIDCAPKCPPKKV